MGDLGKNIVEIAAMLISLTLIVALVKNSSGTAEVIRAGTSGFSGLLATASMQGNNFGLPTY